MRREGKHRPETPAACALIVSGEKPEVSELETLLLLPFDASGEEPRVDARRLHRFLGSKETFTNWVKRRAED
jgi:hypothetical protein